MKELIQTIKEDWALEPSLLDLFDTHAEQPVLGLPLRVPLNIYSENLKLPFKIQTFLSIGLGILATL
ncbi:hypothetical protein AJ80_09922 [Polytolypa hystricis UAMH7299]|uniref:Uncharacterized protein n=1 Tax=Polytolypa hystricis (strain UAMH7299) TaxID=1447883 RepID=A0A2B7WGG0_POLH7|nr:hypothetical protein AJ80_09922 [Polytolypa hystricis UAMH7299]